MGTIFRNGIAYSGGGSSNKFNENEFVVEDNVVSLKNEYLFADSEIGEDSVKGSIDADSLGGTSADSILRDIEKLKEINPIKVKGKVGSFEELPSGAEIGDLYFVNRDGEEDSDEYVWTEDGWEKVGNMDIDLSEIEEQIEKKVNKTVVSNGDSEGLMNRIVPEGAQMGMVSKISGNTYKTKNLLNWSGVNLTTTNGITATLNGDVLNLNGTSVGGYGSCYIDIMSDTINSPELHGTTYTIKLFKDIPNDEIRLYRLMRTTGDWMEVGNSEDALQFTAYDDNHYLIRIAVRTSGTVLNNYKLRAQIVKSSLYSSDTYEPYGELWNSSVDKIVSRGLNMANTIYGKTINATYGSEGDGNGAITDYVEVDYRETYYITGISSADNCFYAWYNADKKFIHRCPSTIRTSIIVSDLPANAKYIRVNQYLLPSDYNKVNYMMSVDAPKPYAPYNKTTVEVPFSIKSLPDYGCSVGDIKNEVDFENGVYYHRVSQWSPSPSSLGANSATETTHVYTSVPDNAKKVEDFKWLCNLYEQVTNDWWNNNKSTRNMVFASGTGGTAVQFVDKSCTTLEQYKTKVENVIFYYELATPEIIPLSTYLRPLPVEPGGTITLENAHNLDMDNTIKYKMEV